MIVKLKGRSKVNDNEGKKAIFMLKPTNCLEENKHDCGRYNMTIKGKNRTYLIKIEKYDREKRRTVQ